MGKPPLFDGQKNVWDAEELVRQVQTALTNYKYAIVGCSNCFSSPKAEESSLPSQCTESQLAAFLLAVEPGAFILCNGWDEHFDLPLGEPLAPAIKNSKTGKWTRQFKGGARVSWIGGHGNVTWAELETVV